MILLFWQWLTSENIAKISAVIGILSFLGLFIVGIVWIYEKIFPNKKNHQSQVSNTYNYGVTQQEYGSNLAKDIARVTTELTKAHESEKSNLLRQKSDLEEKLRNIEDSYQQYINSLEERIARLEGNQYNFPPDILEKALDALAHGGEDEANILFQSVSDAAEPHIKAAAEAVYQQGLIAYSKADYRAALKHYERAVQLVPSNSDYVRHVGILHSNMYNFEKAVGFFEQALKRQIEEHGENDQKVITTRQHLGGVYFNLGRNNEGFQQIKLAYEANVKIHGQDSEEAHRSLHNLASSYSNLGNHKEALKIELGLLEYLLQHYPDGHKRLGTTKNSIGLFYMHLDNYLNAIKYVEEALKDEIKWFGKDHPEVTAIRTSLANMYIDCGRIEDAKTQLRLAIDADLKTYGENHPQVTNNQARLARLF